MEAAYTLIQSNDEKEIPVNDLKKQLETGKESQKIQAMKTILAMMLNGESLNGLLMHVIRFVMPSKNKPLKKLCFLYWEICAKRNSDGTPRPEMVLVCNALRNDLLHPNEFIRGQCLRLLCKLKEADILEPLIPSVRQCLEHKHPYVRKNAVLAIFSIFKIHQYLIPDANELIEAYLGAEADQSARRNALIMLINTALPVAVQYFHNVATQIVNFDQQLQLAFIELIRKDCRSPSADKARYIQTVISLLTVASPSVRYEAANTLVYLSSHASAVKAAASCYIELAVKESDNNVKLIVLSRINELREKNERILDDSVMDILRVVSSPDLSVRRKCLSIAMEMVSGRNVDEVITFLKKELVKTHDQEYEKTNEYRQLLIQSIHTCAIKFPEVADSVVHVLMEFLNDSNKLSAVDVVTFVKEVMERFEHLRSSITSSLLDSFLEMKTGRTLRGALWAIGEYANDEQLIERSLESIRESLGPIPIVDHEEMLQEPHSPTVAEEKVKSSTPKRILADGTYATETIYSSANGNQNGTANHSVRPPLRTLIFAGDFFVTAVLGSTLTKLALRYAQIASPIKANAFKTEVMLIITSIIRVGKSSFVSAQIDEDSYGRLVTCIRVLASNPIDNAMVQSFLNDSRKAFGKIIESRDKVNTKTSGSNIKAQVDDVVNFRLLKSKKNGENAADEDVADLTRATGAGSDQEIYISKLNRIMQLTGYSDPVYAETLQNLTIEFSALGDLKLVEKPTPQTIGPHGFHSIKANFKVSSTENGIIFGNIVYDGAVLSEFNSVVLNDIHIDIMDYIKPKTCSETKFRSMWEEFEWENKVIVTTYIKDLRQYLDFVLKATNMHCLTAENALSGDCGFLAANMYSQSIFGEDALANICLELTNNVITGHIRIRSKTQGIALALGEKTEAPQPLSDLEYVATVTSRKVEQSYFRIYCITKETLRALRLTIIDANTNVEDLPKPGDTIKIINVEDAYQKNDTIHVSSNKENILFQFDKPEISTKAPAKQKEEKHRDEKKIQMMDDLEEELDSILNHVNKDTKKETSKWELSNQLMEARLVRETIRNKMEKLKARQMMKDLGYSKEEIELAFPL
ncbi:coatomer subunit beta [Boothiomyces macroporosus]|uniref:Coatomer subunit beta n=1 Tax=Boothiomyces macroporosus TaxID=261099 RepID=A0AAD5UG12_9FUNG|nr:coatomer subunit beta [Boothiomyces macroporosus]